jgi:SRSO17 transposase
MTASSRHQVSGGVHVKVWMRGLFTQERVAASAKLFLDGLLGDERRKTGWMRAEAPFGNWQTQTFVAGLRDDGLVAP